MNEIDKWLNSGAEVNEGLRLLSIYAPGRCLDRLVRASPRHVYLIRKKLLPFAEGIYDDAARLSDSIKRQSDYGGNFRKKWTFLSDPECPAELKILAADMITCWHNYVDYHDRLYQCTSLDGCFEISKKLMENFIENRKILSEFSYYKEHHSVLGKHPVFAETKRLSELRKMPVSELFRKRKNLDGAIWRISHEMKKGDRPHLDAERETRLASKRRELDEVNKMIEDYERRDSGRKD